MARRRPLLDLEDEIHALIAEARREVWVVGKYVAPAEPAPLAVWEILGVFDSRERAVRACTKPTHFIAPMLLNRREPERTRVLPGAEYPLRA